MMLTRYKNLRLYAFTNFYLNTISQGIQPAHVIAKMARKYRNQATDESELFWQWTNDAPGLHNETLISCNGGMAADIVQAYLAHKPILDKFDIPSEIFYEEPRAFGSGDLPRESFPTCWACVLPQELYDAKLVKIGDSFAYAEALFMRVIAQPYSPLFKFIEYKNACPLAR